MFFCKCLVYLLYKNANKKMDRNKSTILSRPRRYQSIMNHCDNIIPGDFNGTLPINESNL